MTKPTMRNRLLVGKYHPYDPSPEAVRWRKENKKRVRPHVCKLPGPWSWLRPVLLVLVAGLIAAATL